MKKANHLLFSVFAILLTGCTTVTKPNLVSFVPENPRQQIPMSIQLVLDSKYKTAEWQKDKWHVDLGSNLSSNAEQMSRALFDEVTVTSDADPLPGTQAVLIPELLSTDSSSGMWNWSESRFNLIHAWTLSTPDGRLLWRQDIKAEGVGNSGNAWTFEKKMKERVEFAVKDLFLKSYEAMASAQAIRQYADSR